MPKPFFRGLSNKANTAAQGYARDLLTKVKDLPLGTEATVSFTEDGQCSWEVGDLKEMRVKVKDLQVPYYSLHNHASNGILSPEDIFQLAKHDNMKGIGAVGHDGALHTCEKVFGYKKENFNRWMDGLLEKYPLYQSQDANKVETALKQRIDLANELRQDGDKHGTPLFGITRPHQKKLSAGVEILPRRALTRTMTLSRVISTGFQTLHVQMRLLLWSF